MMNFYKIKSLTDFRAPVKFANWCLGQAIQKSEIYNTIFDNKFSGYGFGLVITTKAMVFRILSLFEYHKFPLLQNV